MNTYLGQKGYTISKNELSIGKQVQIRNDLTIKPFIMGSPINEAKTNKISLPSKLRSSLNMAKNKQEKKREMLPTKTKILFGKIFIFWKMLFNS